MGHARGWTLVDGLDDARGRLDGVGHDEHALSELIAVFQRAKGQRGTLPSTNGQDRLPLSVDRLDGGDRLEFAIFLRAQVELLRLKSTTRRFVMRNGGGIACLKLRFHHTACQRATDDDTNALL